jgi:F-type H+-transporting ATPase subunit alpha
VSRIGGKAQPAAIKREAGRMKLDYLQFLDLEVFTRFGARLEAGMEAQLKRGAILRELLQQDRLDPLSIRFQLAWLIAFNAGLFEGLDPKDLPAPLARLRAAVEQSPLTLDDGREHWLAALRDWLGTREPAQDGETDEPAP